MEFKESDRNIEKRKTLASSIYFSYKTLKENEKFIFEILSLFPNGIYTENLRTILNDRTREKASLFRISLNEINSLEKKSLIENNNGNIRLQSIVGRFAEQEFKKRENTSQYFKEVYKYNYFLLQITFFKNGFLKEYQRRKIIENNCKNFLKVFQFIEDIDIDIEEKINYIYDVINQFSFLNNYDELIHTLNLVKNVFDITEIEKIFYDAINLELKYYNGEFDESYRKFKQKFPLNEVINYDLNNTNVRDTLHIVIGIYNMEGLESHEIKLIPLNKKLGKDEYLSILFRMGEYDYDNKIKLPSTDNYIYWDMKYNLGLLDESIIEDHLNSLHEKDSLNILQVNYIKAKMNLISKEEIQKLIVVNPYTKGLKMLMYAFLEEDSEKQIMLYENALGYLKHIKYYYIEALYYYSLFLKENGFYDEYERIISEGIELSKKYNYRLLLHNLLCLKNGEKKDYKLKDYPFEDKDINNFLNFSKKLK